MGLPSTLLYWPISIYHFSELHTKSKSIAGWGGANCVPSNFEPNEQLQQAQTSELNCDHPWVMASFRKSYFLIVVFWLRAVCVGCFGLGWTAFWCLCRCAAKLPWSAIFICKLVFGRCLRLGLATLVAFLECWLFLGFFGFWNHFLSIKFSSH